MPVKKKAGKVKLKARKKRTFSLEAYKAAILGHPAAWSEEGRRRYLRLIERYAEALRKAGKNARTVGIMRAWALRVMQRKCCEPEGGAKTFRLRPIEELYREAQAWDLLRELRFAPVANEPVTDRDRRAARKARAAEAVDRALTADVAALEGAPDRDVLERRRAMWVEVLDRRIWPRTGTVPLFDDAFEAIARRDLGLRPGEIFYSPEELAGAADVLRRGMRGTPLGSSVA